VVIGNTTVDYSQPIVLASPPITVVPSASPSAGTSATGDQSAPADQAMGLLDAARATFAQGDYSGALTECDQAIARLPNSAVAHEFRGLTLFALHRYKEAAGPVYAVLSVGPGWNWATLSSFYPRPAVYAGQLRALEQYVGSHQDVAEARFLLAYHYMVDGHDDAAAEQFKAAVKLNAQDHLSAQLLIAMTPKAVQQAPAPSAAAAIAKPVEASALAGVWTAARADGTTITLNLAPDANYTWKFAQKDKPREFSGTYVVADNLLILNEGNSAVMVGQVAMLADNQFNFKLAGDNPSDPGLTFAK
jgi:tetratricopeptide (TPR) repeat protein